ncbi:hypothetical protein, partial [Mucilaginibacter sp. 5C4]
MKKNKLTYIAKIALLAGLPAIMFSSCKKDDVVANPPTPVTTTGTVSAVSGLGNAGFANGAASVALFSYPTGITLDAAGNLLVADQFNNQIRKIVTTTNATTGVVTVTASTLAGTLASGSSNATAIGTIASFNNPSGVAVDATGNVYVADFGNNQIRKIASTGAVTTLAGATASGKVDATGTTARFSGPAGIAVNATTGDIYVADFNNHVIRKVTAAGVVTTVAGNGAGNVDGTGTAAKFNGPRGIAIN